ncbi:MAG: ADP-L-glycero-D-manno-heptose-6-epimerase [Bacteroides sp. SM23_62_1]|nr:MAG: ADP-L-glycero-D-manno-heptose-6-epimerase [Bacteroides sp. SM23_62_1]
MIVVTGAAGFIGSIMTGTLNREGFNDLVLVDDFRREDKLSNYVNRQYSERIDRDDFFGWLKNNHRFVQFIIHLGARTDTTESDSGIFERLNFGYSVKVWEACVSYGLPLIYASSAATYGNGEHGYDDNHELISRLKPLNPYSVSKNDFDIWALGQDKKPFFWAGIKFFNVFGPNEYHKGRMASVVFHTYNQIQQTGKMKLFRSHRPEFADGEQKRDFIYVFDTAEVMLYFLRSRNHSGIYNLGTGSARTFNSLALAVFDTMGLEPVIEYIDTPADIRDSYQYFTEAKMTKLRSAGYQKDFTPFETAIHDYVKGYLIPGRYF